MRPNLAITDLTKFLLKSNHLARQVKMLVAELDNLSLVPEILMVEKRMDFLKIS